MKFCFSAVKACLSLLAVLGGIAGWTASAEAMPPLPAHDPTAVPAGFIPPQVKNVGVDERFGNRLPLELPLTDHDGKQVRLGDYFKSGRPVVVNFGYYGCPMLCGEVIRGLTASLQEAEYTPGVEFDVVTIGIDPKETWELAGQKRREALHALGKPAAAAGWTFAVGEPNAIALLTAAAGFKYVWDEGQKQWNHPAVLVVASPDGRISRYLYGIRFAKQDVALAVVEAGEGKIGSLTDRFLVYCYTYDPNAGRYVLFAQNLMRAGGALTLLSLGAFLFLQLRRGNKPAPAAAAKP